MQKKGLATNSEKAVTASGNEEIVAPGTVNAFQSYGNLGVRSGDISDTEIDAN